jgi:hypothetical protein
MGHGLSSSRVAPWLVLILLAAMCVPPPAGAAFALPHLAAEPGRPAADLPATDTVQLGPITAKGGFELYITEQDCGSTDGTWFQLDYVKQASAGSFNSLSHTFTGFAAACSIQRSAFGARLRARLTGLLNVNVAIGNAGNALTSPGLPVGCGAPFGPEYPATAHGTIDVAIDPSVLGRINRQSANAQIFSGAPQRCPASEPSGGRELTADVGAAVLDASVPAHSAAQLEIEDPDVDEPAPGISDTLQLQASGRGAYASTNADGSARLGSGAPFTSGSLSFRALAACPGDSAENGTLSGTLTIHDPLLGSVAVSGTDASLAFTGQGTARPGGCNGLSAEPVEPALLSTCSYTPSGCSVSGGSGAVTLFDETDPGTQTISSETVNFGDGSPTAPIANYGTVSHAYAASGTYTVTLTVTDAMGASSSTTILVYIDP